MVLQNQIQTKLNKCSKWWNKKFLKGSITKYREIQSYMMILSMQKMRLVPINNYAWWISYK